MNQPVLVICFDGLDPRYLENIELPTFRFLAGNGFQVTGKCVIPSVTNVNNVSIVTGSFPRAHGITSNYYHERKTGKGVFMESPRFLNRETVFQRLKKEGGSSALLTSKDKLKKMLEPGVSVSVAAEHPPAEYIEAVGPSRGIYSAAINYWLLDAATHTIRTRRPDLVYATTTDYMMHRFPPGAAEMTAYLGALDTHLARLVEAAHAYSIYITADHGMSDKNRGVDLEKHLALQGIEAVFVPAIKDRYVVHHDNLGGMAYLYLGRPEKTGAALACLRGVPGIEEAYSREEAAGEFKLFPERTGDIVVLADEQTVFGSFAGLRQRVSVRSHGSRYESRVPIIGFRGRKDAEAYEYNLDVIRNLD